MYDYILFDLDGTLTDSKEGILNCVQYALSKMGITETNPDNLLYFVGPPLVDAFSERYAMSKEDALTAVSFYRERYPKKGIFENSVIDGIPELLEKLKNKDKHLCVATSKPQVYAIKILEHFNLIDYFEIIVGAEFDGTRNNKKDVIDEVLKNIPKTANPVMVGDRKHDVIGAKLCNIPCIGVKFGYAEKGELEEAGASKIVSTPEELYEVLLG